MKLINSCKIFVNFDCNICHIFRNLIANVLNSISNQSYCRGTRIDLKSWARNNALSVVTASKFWDKKLLWSTVLIHDKVISKISMYLLWWDKCHEKSFWTPGLTFNFLQRSEITTGLLIVDIFPCIGLKYAQPSQYFDCSEHTDAPSESSLIVRV